MMQSWHDLLFAHWPIPPETLRPLVPAPLELDSFDGETWLAVTPFYLRMKPRGLPLIHKFPEMNCRTYVTFQGKPGIFFFSLDAGSRLAVWGARTFYLLPYFNAKMQATRKGTSIEYSSSRTSSLTTFKAEYEPHGPVRTALRGDLEHWLTERYCLYTHARGRLYRGEIHHAPWPLQDANCRISENTIAAAAGIQLPAAAPLLHFARELNVLIWPLHRAS
jgi:uncharacterized protein YqjF (DUF2071 family)